MRTRILVVDDDRLVADTLSLVYRANGYDARARYSTADGLECAKSFDPAVVLYDVALAGESGLQFARRMQEELPATRMLMLTSYASNSTDLQAHSRDAKIPLKLLGKPCRPEDLLRETRALLNMA